ncbi:hypothetical protein HYH03_011169 [Edaphochlamys debaryana]|uniref:RNA 3'-terminal phosphate cyclase-like protein n=1 Tax=Edaphochlamys debaryana TaxID=47281 RepID=A0A835XSG3_9CHLO|nr:hypothetical protein HYH03_011169 [Edaphochlamys debaryana]|eukprot:KAG2490367.1 hypothetical protein HYH03_011169 [Edaphochlamys debaryana]
MLKFKGCQHFRQRLVCSTLSGRPIRIDDIRAADPESPGLRDFEASFLRLLEKLTNGCVVEINETGTSLRYRPGVVVCGSGLVHDCGSSRAIGYFLEPLLVLGLYGKKPLHITLRGITNDPTDPGVDTVRTVTLPLMRKALGLDDGLELRVVSRGAAPGGGGEVVLRVPIVRQLSPIKMEDEGMVKRIRGVAYSMKVSPQMTNRMVDGARGVLNSLLADVYVFTDAATGAMSGTSPGFGVTLVAETTSGALIGAEACAAKQAGGDTEEAGPGPQVPEEVGVAAAHLLLEEIKRGGVVDGGHQGLFLLLCALGPEEANSLRLGPLTPHAVRTMRHIRDFFGVTFALRPEPASGTLFATCVGADVRNVSRRVT